MRSARSSFSVRRAAVPEQGGRPGGLSVFLAKVALLLSLVAGFAAVALAQEAGGEARTNRQRTPGHEPLPEQTSAAAAAGRYELPADVEAAISRLATDGAARRPAERRPPRVIPLSTAVPATTIPIPPARPPDTPGDDALTTGDVGLHSAEADARLRRRPRGPPGPGNMADTTSENGEDEPPRGFIILQAPRARAQLLARDPASGEDGDGLRAERIAAPALSRTSVSLVVRSLPLEAALKEVGKLTGHTVNVATGVEGVLRDRVLEGSVDKILDSLAEEFSLFWFNDGYVIHVDPRDDQRSHLFRIDDMSRQQFNARLAETGLARFRARIQFNGRERFVRATGSDAFIRAVEAALSIPKEEAGGKIEVIRFGIAGR
jgi:hypothetical protein